MQPLPSSGGKPPSATFSLKGEGICISHNVLQISHCVYGRKGCLPGERGKPERPRDLENFALI